MPVYPGAHNEHRPHRALRLQPPDGRVPTPLNSAAPSTPSRPPRWTHSRIRGRLNLRTLRAQVLKDARALAVLVRPQFLDNARTAIARAGERRIHVWHAHLEEVRNDAVAWSNLITTNVGDNDGTVRSNPQLGAVRITDPYPFLESECGLQPRYRRSYVWVDEHRSDGGGRRRTIGQHGRDSNDRRAQGTLAQDAAHTAPRTGRRAHILSTYMRGAVVVVVVRGGGARSGGVRGWWPIPISALAVRRGRSDRGCRGSFQSRTGKCALSVESGSTRQACPCGGA